MSVVSEIAYPALTGFMVTFVVGLLIVLTKRWHGAMTFDTMTELRNIHGALTPRVGGLAVFVGFWAAAGVTVPPARELLFVFGVSGIVAFAAGLMEDCTKNISVAWRFFATALSGLAFCLLTGYAVSRVEIAVFDSLLGFSLVSIAFTVFAIACLAHAVNIIDGVHGLASGSVLIMLCAFAIVASAVGDRDVVLLTAVMIGGLAAFLLLNFPAGSLFLGDGGAYFIGLFLAYVAVMLPMRNPDVSPWISLLVLAYPVLETVFSIVRRTARRRYSPVDADGLHLHTLVYRRVALKIAKAMGAKAWGNPMAGALMWGWPISSLVAVLLIPFSREWVLLVLFMQAMLYGLIYRRLTLFGRGRVRPPFRSLQGKS